jgi:hypothetical protein
VWADGTFEVLLIVRIRVHIIEGDNLGGELRQAAKGALRGLIVQVTYT